MNILGYFLFAVCFVFYIFAIAGPKRDKVDLIITAVCAGIAITLQVVGLKLIG